MSTHVGETWLVGFPFQNFKGLLYYKSDFTWLVNIQIIEKDPVRLIHTHIYIYIKEDKAMCLVP